MTLYDLYKFHKGKYNEDITKYKGYRIEIYYDKDSDRYCADAFDLKAKEYVLYPCVNMGHTEIDNVIKKVIKRIDKKIELNDRDKDILIYE